MNPNNSIILIFFILSFFSRLVTSQEGQVGFLSVNNSSNMNIYLDTLFIANHSFSNLSLKPGKYTIQAVSPLNRSWLERGYQKTVQIVPDTCIQINIKTTKFLNLITRPYGCNVYFNDNLLGITPLLLNEDTCLNQSILIKKKGYQDKWLTINDSGKNYHVILNELDEKMRRLVLKEKHDKKDLYWKREGLIISSIITCWGAFFLKREADYYYDKYKSTSNPGLIDKYYHKTEDYDRYAEISLGISIISLGTYFYFLLTE